MPGDLAWLGVWLSILEKTPCKTLHPPLIVANTARESHMHTKDRHIQEVFLHCNFMGKKMTLKTGGLCTVGFWKTPNSGLSEKEDEGGGDSVH